MEQYKSIAIKVFPHGTNSIKRIKTPISFTALESSVAKVLKNSTEMDIKYQD